ncbi:hypothetical protein PYCCODRAFT_1475335 [Trametes coccinea BRFM310]|uniref:Uncharacterized protein n=1 Tax=Trametes coccinea (strain BRFM310) TaxID=1353009 RepID=A0A1Y2IVS0_TRAC3|nr:hypothetical protein PYCCODRAFT_1475335 [Trametes coccinea BRFM310]
MLQLPTNSELYVDDTQLAAVTRDGFISTTYISDKTAAELSPLVPLLHDRTYGAVSLPGTRIVYHFYGNAVDVVGLVLPWTGGNLSSADIDVDGTNPQKLTWIAPNITSSQLNVTYYSLGPSRLNLEYHNLTITVTQASSDDPWLIDYVRIANVQYPATGTSTALTEYGAATSTVTASSTPSNSTASTPGTEVSGSESSFPLIPVIGGMVGGVVLLAILFVLLFVLWRRSYSRAHIRNSTVKGG